MSVSQTARKVFEVHGEQIGAMTNGGARTRSKAVLQGVGAGGVG